MLSALSPARRRFVGGLLALLVMAVAVVGGTVAVRSLRAGATEVTPVAQDAQPPVLLVPGYGGATGDLEPLAAALRAQGREATIVHLAGDGTGDLNVQAGVLQAAVRTALRAGARSVDIVGYSAGGVTARLWLRAYDGGSVARRIVTLGSPQHGTDLASLASDIAPDSCPAACRQLVTDSDLVRSLNSGDETPAGPAVGLDLDHRRPGLHPAGDRVPRRVRSTSPSSRSAPAARSPTGSSRPTRP